MSFECANGFLDETGRSSLLPRVTESYLSKESMLQLRRDRSPLARTWRSVGRTLNLPPVLTILNTNYLGWAGHGVLDVPGGYWATYYDYWRGIVERFTQRQLTNRQDKLPALAGLADEFHRATGGTYIAGMWKEELLESLAWTVNNLYNPKGTYGDYPGYIPLCNFVIGPYPEGAKSSDYVAPSWSWASTQGSIRFFQGTYHIDRTVKKFAKVESVQIEPKHKADRLGALTSGILVLIAAFLSIPDPQIPCPDDYTLKTIHNDIRRQTRQGLDYTTEFDQHHAAHPGQEFALVKLFEEKGREGQVGDRMYMLLLESTGDGCWRRCTCLNVLMVTLKDLEEDSFKYMDPSVESDREYIENLRPALKETAEMATEIRGAPWAKKRVTLY